MAESIGILFALTETRYAIRTFAVRRKNQNALLIPLCCLTWLEQQGCHDTAGPYFPHE